MSRTRRFLGGLSLGYLQTGLVTMVGLWLTPFYLSRLGESEYGLWLLGTQVIAYLSLLDLGVVAILPREVAYRVGEAGGETSAALRQVVGETTRLVLWQTPVVAVIGLMTWWLLPGEWTALRGPLAVVLVTFVVMFPCRVSLAILQGLQDLARVGLIQLSAWGLGVTVTVVAVRLGSGLYGLAWGWMVVQVVAAGLALGRLRHHFPVDCSFGVPRLSLQSAQRHLGRGGWVSVTQMAQVLLSGTDLLVIGAVLGPKAVVPYACTAKLVLLLANQPQLFMETAVPALSELRTGVPRAHLFRVSTAVSQAMLLVSGAVVCLTLAVNGSFVTWWVGADRFAGVELTVWLLLVMLLRHWNVATGSTLFCFGYERRLALTGVADGVVTLAAMLALVPWLGARGAVLGGLVGVCAVSLPGNLRALAREEGIPVSRLLRPLRPWGGRLVLVVTIVWLAIVAGPAVRWLDGLWGVAAGSALVGGLYLAVMWPVLLTPPLGTFLMPRLESLAASHRWAARLAALGRSRPPVPGEAGT